jgi:hypothetical protein
LGPLSRSDAVWVLAGFGLILFLIQAMVKAMADPKNKYEIPPVKIPGCEVIATGSAPGCLSMFERVYSVAKHWAWHATAAGMIFVGFAADYIHAHIGWVDGKYGAWVASVVFGVVGVIRAFITMRALKAEDTRQMEVK